MNKEKETSKMRKIIFAIAAAAGGLTAIVALLRQHNENHH